MIINNRLWRLFWLLTAGAMMAGCASPHLATDQKIKLSTAAAPIQDMPVPESDNLAQGSIGAVVRNDNGSLIVEGLLPGGPADNSGSVRPGDRIIGVAPTADTDMQSVQDMSQAEAVRLIRGEPDTLVRLSLLGQGEVETRQVTLTRAIATADQHRAYRKARVNALAIPDNNGQFLSPYTSDGVVADWVDKAINANMGAAAGSAVGAAAGSYAASKALENVPFAGMFGGIAGSKAGKSAGRNAAIEASGGEAYMRATSDLSFHSLEDMARWLVGVHGDSGNLQEVVKATTQVYPGLQEALVKVR